LPIDESGKYAALLRCKTYIATDVAIPFFIDLDTESAQEVCLLIRPRLTDFHGIASPQADLDFAIPFFDEDIPLYVDPFLLWRSPSQQDQALHTSLVNAFNYLGALAKRGKTDEAIAALIAASECDEVGMGSSVRRKGKRLGKDKAREVISLFSCVPQYRDAGFRHFEEIQLYIDGISKDRVSDISCNFL
jgi:hypothetical protein